MQLIKSLSKN